MKLTLDQLKSVLHWPGISSQKANTLRQEELMTNRSVEPVSSEYTSLDDAQIDETMGQRSHNQTSHNYMREVSPMRFPPEIWFDITFHSAYPAARQGSGNAAAYNDNKTETKLLWHLGSVSKFHRQLVLRYWVHTIRLLDPVDFEKLIHLGAANGIDLMSYMRCLVCKDGYDIYRAPKHAFEGFGLIEELVLNCHQDINFGGRFGQPDHLGMHAEPQAGAHDDQLVAQGNPGTDAHPQPARMSYRRLKIKFPTTLRTLRVYDSHVPDIYFIQQAAEQCPLLQSLTLARCTLFTRQGLTKTFPLMRLQ
ncbi:unnamed protein product [Rhizoctonia solani]|uniref:Uncharacterized protein n=1 Tax=Rhizoctonia solani TaxID=456999 RepID=A0A8H2XSU4_9AGAM|nr:unnamed protein product [Rhizoctonia solani]CAE6473274.1 unnamed protein product [Rhizoctonia solani]